MKVLEVLIDESIKDCMNCPLTPSNRRDCGKECRTNVNGGVVFSKKPDKRCKLKSCRKYKGQV